MAISRQGHTPAEVYLRQDVDSYLAEMHQYIESLHAKVAEGQTTVHATNANGSQQASEATLGKALIRAQSVAEQRIKDAEAAAEAILAGARRSAEDLSNETRSAAESILSAARAEANRVVEQSRQSAASLISEARAEAERLVGQATLRSEAIRPAQVDVDHVAPPAPAALTAPSPMPLPEPSPGGHPSAPDEATWTPRSDLPMAPPTGVPVVPVVAPDRKSDGKSSGIRRSLFKR